MHFLGNVNMFHGRVQSGKAHLGPLAVEYPEHPHAEARPASGFARPYELDVDARAGDGRPVGHAAPRDARRAPSSGSSWRTRTAAVLQVEMPRERHAALAPRLGERLYLQPRALRVFVDPA